MYMKFPINLEMYYFAIIFILHSNLILSQAASTDFNSSIDDIYQNV